MTKKLTDLVMSGSFHYDRNKEDLPWFVHALYTGTAVGFDPLGLFYSSTIKKYDQTIGGRNLVDNKELSFRYVSTKIIAGSLSLSINVGTYGFIQFWNMFSNCKTNDEILSNNDSEPETRDDKKKE